MGIRGACTVGIHVVPFADAERVLRLLEDRPKHNVSWLLAEDVGYHWDVQTFWGVFDVVGR